MRRTLVSRLVGWTTLAVLAVAFGTVEQPVAQAQIIKKAVTKRARRLPAHYGQVVTEEQKERIYKIQEEYEPRIAELQAQLNALKKERDQKVAAVLTPEQQKKVDEAATKAKESRAKRKAAAATPAESASPATTAEPKPAK